YQNARRKRLLSGHYSANRQRQWAPQTGQARAPRRPPRQLCDEEDEREQRRSDQRTAEDLQPLQLITSKPTNHPSHGFRKNLSCQRHALRFLCWHHRTHFQETKGCKSRGGELWHRNRQGDLRRTPQDRKSTRLNSSHVKNSYAVFCLKKKENSLQRC